LVKGLNPTVSKVVKDEYVDATSPLSQTTTLKGTNIATNKNEQKLVDTASRSMIFKNLNL